MHTCKVILTIFTFNLVTGTQAPEDGSVLRVGDSVRLVSVLGGAGKV